MPSEGRLEGASIPEILWKLGQARVDGALIVERRGVRKIVYFHEGRVVFAASTDAEDRLGHFLLKRGEVRLPPLLDAGARVVRGRRLGEILIEQGAMDPAAVVRAVMDQVREIVLSVFSWREGSWRISPARLPADESITLDLPMEDLILTGVRRVRDWTWIRRAVGGPRAVYRLAPEGSRDLAGFGMTERAILEQVERPSRVDMLCREVYAPSYAVYRSLWALAILGLVERIDPHPVQETLAGPGEGFVSKAGVADLLLDLGDGGFTGVVRLFRGSDEGAIHLEKGRVQFATTNDPDLSLAGHLLRRGIISEQDHANASRRLLSGKRLGTLLAEDGAIDAAELDRFVRAQVLEVARTLLLWTEGEYRIEETLPSEEEITLALSVEDIVMAAFEGLDSFIRIWDAVGGMTTLYRLLPEYLDRLDRMTLRPAIWEVVSLLGQERTVEEILAARPEPDFELCRLLYALERVRVVEQVSTEEILRRARLGGEAVKEPAEALRATLVEPERFEERAVEDVAEEAARTAAEIAPELFSGGESRAPSLPESDDELPTDDVVDEAPTDAHNDEGARLLSIEAEEHDLAPLSGAADAVEPPSALSGAEESDAQSAELIEAGFEAIEADESPSAGESGGEEAGDELGAFSDPGEAPAISAAFDAAGAPPAAEVWQEPAPEEDELSGPELTANEGATFEPSAEPEPVASDAPAEDVFTDDELVDKAPEPLAKEVARAEEPSIGDAFDDSFGEAEAPREESALDEERDAFDGAGEAAAEPDFEGPASSEVAEAERAEEAFDPLAAHSPAETVALDREALDALFGPAPSARDEPEADEGERDEAAASEPPTDPPIEQPASDAASEEFAAPDEPPPSSESAEGAHEFEMDEPTAGVEHTGPVDHWTGAEENADRDERDAAEYALDEPGAGVAPFGSDLDSTLELPRSGLPVDEPEISPQIREAVAHFNRRHGALYQRLRIEVGSGVSHFVRTCQGALGEQSVLFDGLEPDRDGVFDEQALGARIAAREVPDPRAPLDALIEEELAMVRHLLDPHTFGEILREVEEG